MKIAVDASPLQSLHRMRGIGSVVRELLCHIPKEERSRYVILLYPADGDQNKLPDIPDGYEIRYLQQKDVSQKWRLPLPWKLKLINKALNYRAFLAGFRHGSPRARANIFKDVSVYLQIDPSVPMPKMPRWVHKTLFVHDIIPYVLEWDYLPTFRWSKRSGQSYKSAIKAGLRRWSYRRTFIASTRYASTLLANSKTTKEDLHTYFGIRLDKITVTHLGVEAPLDSVAKPTQHYVANSWGYFKQKLTIDLEETQFLLFVGGGDKRRKLQDLITAFNHLRAEGQDVKLVLCGDSALGAESIDNEDITRALTSSSYLEDIIFLGYTTKEERAWLYGHCLAFVFPSRYEGFGLPVIEAMSYGCPVIAYENRAVKEVAGKAPFYTQDSTGIYEKVKEIKALKPEELKIWSKNSKEQAARYSWKITATRVGDILSEHCNN